MNADDYYPDSRRKHLSGRVVGWFSCGAASAVACKLMLEEHPDAIVAYCDTMSTEHPDNQRFFDDCQEWFGVEILRLKSDRYADIWEVFERTRWLAGVGGARCTTEMKKAVRQRFEDYGDRQYFGFTADEAHRVDRFRANNDEVYMVAPLIEQGISKGECYHRLKTAGIELPMMYRLGYNNNNCIGCVKGQSGYWNKIRRDFPDVFARMAKVERSLNAAICKRYEKGVRIRVFLDELDPDAGRHDDSPVMECGVLCGSQLGMFR